MSNKYSSLTDLARQVKAQVMGQPAPAAPSSLPSSSSPSSHSTSHLASTVSPSSLSTEECSSSRYSSLQDTESLKSAILDSFRMHWVQAWSIMECKILDEIEMDDLSSIINHIEQMISLLLEEGPAVHAMHSYSDKTSGLASYENGPEQAINNVSLGPLLDFLFAEDILDKIYEWSEMAGTWKNIMYIEQLKVYELLISQVCQSADMMLTQKACLSPLIKLLESLVIATASQSMNNIEVDKRLVLLLNSLCMAFTQNPKLLEILFVYLNENTTAKKRQPLIEIETELDSSPDTHLCDSYHARPFTFPVFLLLTQFVHREGAIATQSRDALLLCLALSQSHDPLAYFIVSRTNFCPLLATGLSGLFSSLPRVLIGQSMTADQFQYKDELLHNSKEIEQFLKCLDFCNAVVEISHPVVQAQMLNYIYQGFLVSVIGPALHQDVAHVSIEDLESLPSLSNTLDEIITTTAYLDMFIQSISEPKLVRIFLEFLCLEQFDNRFIINTLISRIGAKSKLSLITLMLFKTLLDLNCEDMQFELIFKYLLRGKHLSAPEIPSTPVNGHLDHPLKQRGMQQAIIQYQQNWLAISGQKLSANSLSHYLHSLCSHQTHQPFSDTDSVASFDSVNLNSGCQCNANYYHNYLDYLNEARYKIAQNRNATKQWKNCYSEPCFDYDFDEDVSFSIVDCNINNNYDSIEQQKRSGEDYSSDTTKCDLLLSNGYHQTKRLDNGSPVNGESFEQPVIGFFLNTLLEEVEKFFDNDVLTNLHLTALIVCLCHSPHKLLLSLFFDETLARNQNVPCLLHSLQKLSLKAQAYCDEIPNFESMFRTAKINLDSVPIGELNCQLLTSNHHHKAANSSALQLNRAIEANLNKGLSKLKSLFGRTKQLGGTLSRRGSNASINSHVLEVIPGGMRFINQNPKPKDSDYPINDKLNELIYNLILFDEFLMEMSAILLEQSIDQFVQ